MNDFDLPPERRLPDGVKQQMKRDLINETAPPTPRRGRPGWITAGVAAVAVAAVAMGGAVLLGGDDPAPTPAQPAGSGTANDPTVPPTAPPTAPLPGPDPDKPIEESAGTAAPPPTDPPKEKVDCQAEVTVRLPGATKRATATYDAGTMSLWGTDARWIVCDDWVEHTPGTSTTTLIGNHPWPTGALSKQLFQLSMNFSDTEAQYFSGGPVPDGVERIDYHFSDGETVTATIGEEIWTMVYLPTDGPFGPGATMDSLSVRVVVTKTGGQTEEFQLKDPNSGELRDFCAQLNHGC